MTEKEETMVRVRIENRISKLTKDIESIKDPDGREWFIGSLKTVMAIRSAMNQGTLGKLLIEHQYDSLWEEWMSLKGMADEI